MSRRARQAWCVIALPALPGRGAQTAWKSGVDLLQQVGWPNRFVIYEAWKDQSAYDANEKAAHMSGFCDTLRSISVAPCDRHAYFVVSVGPARVSAGANPIEHDVAPGRFPEPASDRTVVAKQVAEAARKGEGNLRYDVVSEVSTPFNYMTVFAAWQNRKAFDDRVKCRPTPDSSASKVG